MSRLVGPGLAAAAAFLAGQAAALANDSVAEVGIGGLVLARTQDVEMTREDLAISMKEVKVDYVFRNVTDADVDSVVAFPPPDINADPDVQTALPEGASDNFLDFFVMIDGRMVQPEFDQRAFSLNIDITDDLKKNGIPLYPYDRAVTAALAKLPDATAKDFVDRDIIQIFEGEEGAAEERAANWSLRSAYWWKSSFPAGRDVKVSHRYKPAVGATAGVSFFSDGKFVDDVLAEYEDSYCIDDAFKAAVRKVARPDGSLPYAENRLQYVLTTGGNWSAGTIGTFKLTVDKGDARNLVSFCGEGVKKVGPTTFEMTQTDFFPEDDLDILILTPIDQ